MNGEVRPEFLVIFFVEVGAIAVCWVMESVSAMPMRLDSSKLALEVLSWRIFEKPHPVVEPAKLPPAALAPGFSLSRGQQLSQTVGLRTSSPEPINDSLLIPDNAIALSVPRRGSLPSRTQTNKGRSPRISPLLARHRSLSQLDELPAFQRGENVVENQGEMAVVLGKRRGRKVDGAGCDGTRGRCCEERGGDGDGVVGVVDWDWQVGRLATDARSLD